MGSSPASPVRVSAVTPSGCAQNVPKLPGPGSPLRTRRRGQLVSGRCGLAEQVAQRDAQGDGLGAHVRRGASPHQQAPGCFCLLAGSILIEVLLQGGKAAMAADLSHLTQAQPSGMGGGEGGPAEAV